MDLIQPHAHPCANISVAIERNLHREPIIGRKGSVAAEITIDARCSAYDADHAMVPRNAFREDSRRLQTIR